MRIKLITILIYMNTRPRSTACLTTLCLTLAALTPTVFAQTATPGTAGATVSQCFEFNPRIQNNEACAELEDVTIISDGGDPDEVPGGADVIGEAELEAFETTNITEALRRVPGVAIQFEDGYGLRPNISIRGTATDRSARITLMEDGVLIAPAPYASPSAYYFPTTGRISRVEVLKGPAAITEGPYTVGGALNLISTPIPTEAGGEALFELGSDSTWRTHAWYGDDGERFGWLVETHQWQSDGYQNIDRSSGDTGLDKEDYLAKFRLNSAPDARYEQQLQLKLQYSDEQSEQSYLGLTDRDLAAEPYRRYGLSEQDVFNAEHEQVQLDYRIRINDLLSFNATVYNNEFERNWFKTEGIDLDGAPDAQSFQRTSWFNVIQAVNRGESIGDFSAADLQAILDGADTATGAIQLRANAREYYSRGIQLGALWDFTTGNVLHQLDVGIRYHEDEEDRLQRNSSYTQSGGRLLLDDLGVLGNAGNRVQQAEALAFYIRDRIEWGRLTLAPGIRYENIDQTRIDYQSQPERNADTLRRVRENDVEVWIPGVGLLYQLSDQWRLIAGVHKGFSAPTNAPGVREEESINYEFGLRFDSGRLSAEALGFFQDYDNLLGTCTASSASNCEPGEAFNGDAVSVPGLELSLGYDFSSSPAYALPFTLAYTWMDAEFDSDIADTDFFGAVSEGDPVPYIPDNQLFATFGYEQGPWALYLSGTYVDEVCVRASCGTFERTDDAFIVDLALHWQFHDDMEVFAVGSNLTEEDGVLGRQPYGARPYRDRSARVGVKFSF